MRVLLVNPKSSYDIYGDLLASSPLVPSLTIATLAGAAKAAGHEIGILDSWIERDVSTTLEMLLSQSPFDVVGITSYTFTFPQALELARKTRAICPAHVPIYIGGLHVSILTKDVLDTGAFDAAVVGEGDQTFVEVLNGQSLSAIKGVYAHREDGSVRGEPRPLIDDLDTLAFPDYQPFELDRYSRQLAPLWNSRKIVYFESSRGCPFHCSFCTSNILFGRRWRPKSPGRVVEEIRRVLGFGFEEIHFQDDNFSLDLDRAKEICRQIVGQRIRFPWVLSNGLRVDRVDDEFLALAKSAGCYRIAFGIESGSQEVLDRNRKEQTLSEIRTAVDLVRKHGIECSAMMIIGLPGEDKSSVKATRRFLHHLNLDYAVATIFCPFPGLEVYDQWQQEGRIISHDWSRYFFHRKSGVPYVHPTLTEKELFDAYRMFYRSFYFRARYIFERIRLGLTRGTLRRDIQYFLSVFVWRRFLGRRRRNAQESSAK